MMIAEAFPERNDIDHRGLTARRDVGMAADISKHCCPARAIDEADL
jgi:hypothetical protein